MGPKSRSQAFLTEHPSTIEMVRFRNSMPNLGTRALLAIRKRRNPLLTCWMVRAPLDRASFECE